MRDCIIHIGLHKTGTTAIQQSFFRNKSLQGARYLDFGVPNSSSPLLAAFSTRPEALKNFARSGWNEAEIQRQAEQARQVLEAGLAGPDERVMISAEGLSSHLLQEEIDSLRDRVASHGRRAQVVAYVRSGRGSMESAFQQRAKAGMAQLNPVRLLPRYRDLIEPWDHSFGAEQVTLYPFEPGSFPQGCVVRDFSRRLGLSIDESMIRRANTSLSRGAVALLVFYWRGLRASGNRSLLQPRGLLRLLQEVPGNKLRLAPALVQPAFDHHADQLDWIEQRMGIPMRALGSASPDDVQSEADLLTLHPVVRDWLAEKLGQPVPADTSEQQLGAMMLTLAQQVQEPQRGQRTRPQR